MINVRKSEERGHANYGWLCTFHTFSFNRYYDERYVNFRSLRVINEDWIQPGKGFGLHPHENMEIITYVMEGELKHKDSMGNGSIIKAGEFQRMSAGTGVMHSEFNPSEEKLVHLYQIWLLPDKTGHKPSYEQMTIGDNIIDNRFNLIASPTSEDGSLTIHQDTKIYMARFDEDREITYIFDKNRHGWLQVLSGEIELGEEVLNQGDGASISDEKEIKILANEKTLLLFFDLN